MTKRTILIIAAAVFFALLVGVTWFWFFSRGTETPQNPGTFGTGQERPGAAGTSGASGGNIPSNVQGAGGNQGTTGAGIGTGASGSTGGAGSVPSPAIEPVPGVANVPGVEWLGGTGVQAVSGGGPTTNFVPTDINQLNNGSVGGSVNVLGNFSGGTGGTGQQTGLGLEGALIGAAASAVLCTPGLLGGVAGLVSTVTGGTIAVTGTATGVPVNSVAANGLLAKGFGENTAVAGSDTYKTNFLDCVARAVARSALDQMTVSIVNWINSGFEGKPSFVQNYKQFFTNVADQAAGEFIRGSALSFLCSPFKAQVRVAIAQSYARRNSASCTLSSALQNTNRAFGGGWGGLLSLTTTPTNNPYGAFAYGQIQLANYQSEQINLSKMRISPEGYLGVEEKYDCQTTQGAPQADGTPPKPVCKTRIVTPGSTIARVAGDTLKIPAEQLNLSKNFDEIVSALMRQLIQRTLQQGLSNVSGPQGDYGGYFLTDDQKQAQSNGQQLLENLQAVAQYSQQYGSVWQGAIRDIQSAQEQLNSLANCWSQAAAQTEAETKKAQAEGKSAAALAAATELETKVTLYNANITKANASIARLQELQTRTLNVQSMDDVNKITDEYNEAYNSGLIMTQADVTTAQQDRAALQSALAARNQQTATELQQCYAF